jgi:predicted nucleotidyltransferase
MRDARSAPAPLRSISKQRKVVDSLVPLLLAELESHIHSLVLFGSVARGEERPDSDVDVLVLTEAPLDVRHRIDEITYDIDLENTVFTQLVFLTTKNFEAEARMRSYFSSDIFRDGIVLHDDGTYRRIRQQATSASS